MNKIHCAGNHILIGLGGTGGRILREFKMRIFEEIPDCEQRRKLPVAILYVDSTDEMMPRDGRFIPEFCGDGQNASFTNDEFLHINHPPISSILDHVEAFPMLKGIVKNVENVRSAIGESEYGTSGKRLAGRLLFAANAMGYVDAISRAYSKVQSISGCSGPLCIHIFAGLMGGTGSGSVVDAIVQARKHFPDAMIHVYAMLPEPHFPWSGDPQKYYANAYAALNELNALQTRRWKPWDVTGDAEADYYDHHYNGVATTLTIYSNQNEQGVTIDSIHDLPKLVSDYVFNRLFLANENDSANRPYLRAYDMESMMNHAYEYDESQYPLPMTCEVPVARTKMVKSLGIKRVTYPEQRVLKHITYTIGEKLLYQFKYNNWCEGIGYLHEAHPRDLRAEYLNKENLRYWMLDLDHLTLQREVLPNGQEYGSFCEYWHDKVVNCAQEAQKANCPLMELDNILHDSYENSFREMGVENYYAHHEKVIPEIAHEIRGHVEANLYSKWENEEISINEIRHLTLLLIEHLQDFRTELESTIHDERAFHEELDADRQANLNAWSQMGLLQRMVGVGDRRYAEHQTILTEYYTAKTMLVALDFARNLTVRLLLEFEKLDEDVHAFDERINEAIDNAQCTLAASRKFNYDMRKPVIEVCDDDAVERFEKELLADRFEMPHLARQFREKILPAEFKSFGQLCHEISVRDIADAFDTKLSEWLYVIHEERADPAHKVLGLNLLARLQMALPTDEDVQTFAKRLSQNCGAYLQLNTEQLQLHLRNNEGDLSPTNPASMNRKVIWVSIPSLDYDPKLERFADKLENAIREAFTRFHGDGHTALQVNHHGACQNEITVVTLPYLFPLRCIEWMKTYKEQADRFLHTGNPQTDALHSLLLYSEGNSSQFPPLLADEQYIGQ